MARFTTNTALLGMVLFLGGCSVFSDIEDTLWPSLDGEEGQAQAQAQAAPVPAQPPAQAAPPPPPPLGSTNFQLPPATPGQPTGTFVGGKIVQLRTDLTNLQAAFANHNQALQALRGQTSQNAQAYHGTVASITSRLQVGTTPGNPILTQQWNDAQNLLERLGTDIANMNSLSNRSSADGAMVGFLQESTRSAFSLSGGIDEDHRQLAILEDDVGKTVVVVERLLNELTDDIRRQTEYVTRERDNLTTLALAVKNGELYGTSLANKPFGSVPGGNVSGAATPSSGMASTGIVNRRALVVIRFDRKDVEYQQALYTAVNQALERQPTASFDLVAVTPAKGTPAQTAVSSSDARRNAEAVLRTLSDMGLPAERVNLSAMTSAAAQTNEVHIYLR